MSIFLSSDRMNSGGLPSSGLKGIGRILAVALLVCLLSLEFSSLSKFPYFLPTSNVEEVANTYTIANNYLEYGFWNSRFRQDLSNSPDPADHPYVYTRFPPGPDVITALVLRFSGGSYQAVYLFFALTFLAGIPFYLQFAELILQKLGLVGASYTLLLLGPQSILATLGRMQSTPQPLLLFLPLVALNAYYRTSKRGYLYTALIVGFLSALYLEYSLIALLCCWLLLYFTQLIPIKGKHLLAFSGCVGLGIGLNLFLNFLLLGPGTFLKELAMTLGNRMFGVPSKEEMADFFRAIAVVHHGSTPLDWGTFFAQTQTNFQFPAMGFVLLTAALLAIGVLLQPVLEGSSNARPSQFPMGNWLKLWLWVGGTLSIPAFLFPAYSQQVSLFSMRTNIYFLGIGAVAILGLALKFLGRRWRWAGVYWRESLGRPGIALQGLWTGAAFLLLLLAPIAFALRSWALHGKVFFLGYCGAIALTAFGLVYPPGLVWVLRHPDRALRLGAGLGAGFMLILAPGFFFHRSDRPTVLGFYSSTYALFLLGYSLLFLVAVGVLAQPRRVLNRLEPFKSPKRAIRVLSAIALAMGLSTLVAAIANRGFREFIGPLMVYYLLGYLLLAIGTAGIGFLRPQTLLAGSAILFPGGKPPEDREIRRLIAAEQGIGIGRGAIATLVSAGLMFSLLMSLKGIATVNLTQLNQIQASLREQPSYTQLLDLRQFEGALYMTNVYTSTVGFFTQAAGYGVCNPDSLSDTGTINVSQCQVAFMKQHDIYARQKPRYFFFLRRFYPGFAQCLPEGGTIEPGAENQGCVGVLHRRLSQGFVKVSENSLFEVYDLHRPLISNPVE